MSKSLALSTALLEHLLNNAPLAGIGDAAGLLPSADAGEVFVSLHVGDPGASGTQVTLESSYPGYTRIAIARDGLGWTVVLGTATNAADVAFPECTGGLETLTHFGVGTALSGAGTLLYRGELATPANAEAETHPRFLAGVLAITEN